MKLFHLLYFGILLLNKNCVLSQRHVNRTSRNFNRQNARLPEAFQTVPKPENQIPHYDFSKIGGYHDVKRELQQMKEILLEVHKYKQFNVRTPKGILLEGPPGNGKTLMAKCFAGECGFNFISAAGPEFNEKFVGVGAARVRYLFNQAMENQPCILFIDEIDAIGARRSGLDDGGMVEKSQTLNQLLVLLDGFDADRMRQVIVIAATNQRAILDPALTRSGRFDRIIHVGNPDDETRREIIDIHRNAKPISNNISTDTISDYCDGMSGADIENLLNEVSLRALLNNHYINSISDFDQMREEILFGRTLNAIKLSYETKQRIAIHEWGHVLSSLLTRTHPLPKKVSISLNNPSALGLTTFSSLGVGLMTKQDLEDRVQTLLGGYVAEKIMYDGDISSGASDDLSRVKNILKRMVKQYFMYESEMNFLGESQVSEGYHDQLIMKVFGDLYMQISAKMSVYKEVLEICGKKLVEKHVMFEKDIFECVHLVLGNDYVWNSEDKRIFPN